MDGRVVVALSVLLLLAPGCECSPGRPGGKGKSGKPARAHVAAYTGAASSGSRSLRHIRIAEESGDDPAGYVAVGGGTAPSPGAAAAGAASEESLPSSDDGMSIPESQRPGTPP